MSSDNTPIPSAPASASANDLTRVNRASAGWARDNTPIPTAEAAPADAVNIKPAGGRSAARKKMGDAQDLSPDGKGGTEAESPASKTAIATENVGRDATSPLPRTDGTLLAAADLASSPEQTFDRKGDRSVSEWGREAPPAADSGSNSSLYTLLTGGLLTAGLASNVGG